MLSYLNIKNFAIIEDLELDLHPGMTALTGETGAGKSIIIDSLEFVLGAKTDTTIIRNGAERCEVTAIFDINNLPRITEWLIDKELDSENECILRRVVTKDGRSKNTINGHHATQQIIRELGELLLDIHGQHEHQALLSSERQRELLDAYADSKILFLETKKLYFAWLKAKKDLIEMQSVAENYPAKIEFLTHQLAELENINVNNLEKLRKDQQQLANAQDIITTMNNAVSMLVDNDTAAIISALCASRNQLEKILELHPKLSAVINLLNNSIINAEEATSELRHLISSTELDQDRLEQIEQELTTIHDLARKHHVKPEELIQVRDNLQTQLQRITDATTDFQKLEAEIKNLENAYLESATALSAKRQAASATLNHLISEKLPTLGMSGGEFCIELEPILKTEKFAGEKTSSSQHELRGIKKNETLKQSFSSSGLERINFLVATNPGQPLLALNKIASGGELSRISLAIEVEIATKEITPTLIFDEIDSGIGGKTAAIVGQLLRKLGVATQVICVTHLAQVAAQAHHHLLVEKQSDLNHTAIKITNLSIKERYDEIARMLGGMKITKHTLAHAQELLNSVKD